MIIEELRPKLNRVPGVRVGLTNPPAIRIGGVEVVLITKRTQALGLELFTNLGIDPRSKKVVVVKSTNHFMAAYGPIAKKVLYVDSDAPLEVKLAGC